MAASPIVSVNLTTYNRAPLLTRSLDSILAQTLGNIEVVIADDGSTDATASVVESYRRRDPRIRYFRHHENLGNAAARNTALANSSGEYVAFMDDDDEWIDREKLEKQVRYFVEAARQDLAIVCTHVNIVTGQGTTRVKRVRKPAHPVKHFLVQNGVIYSPTVLTRRETIGKVGGFDEEFRRNVDAEFYRCCIIKHRYDFQIMDDITTNVHETGGDRLTLLDRKSAVLEHIRTRVLIKRKYREHLRKNLVQHAHLQLSILKNHLRMSRLFGAFNTRDLVQDLRA